MMDGVTVLKIGGHDIADETFLAALAAILRQWTQPPVIVHGGGKEISELQTRLNIKPVYADGVRVTDAPSLAVVEMVLCGTVNKRLVRILNAGGVLAQGLSGVDQQLITARQMPHPSLDMGCTGEVAAVRADPLRQLLAAGVTPVIAPVCYGEAHNFNVNADHVAGAVARALSAARVIFLTNVPGVLQEDDLLPHLTPERTQALIDAGVIAGGMIPKVRTALATVQSDVARAVITNLDGLRHNSGTIFTPESVSTHD